MVYKRRKSALKKKKEEVALPIAENAFSSRLLGSSLVQMTIPRELNPEPEDFFDCFNFKFEAIFLQGRFLYAFYSDSVSYRLRLARMCKFSRTWERVHFTSDVVKPTSVKQVLPLPWAGPEGHANQVLIFYGFNVFSLLCVDVNQSCAHLSDSQLDLDDLKFNESQVPQNLFLRQPLKNVVKPVQCVYKFNKLTAAAVDAPNKCLYFQVKMALKSDGEKICLAIFRLDWPSKTWTRLNLVEQEEKRLVKCRFMAVHRGHLFLGLVKKSRLERGTDSLCSFLDLDNMVYSFDRVICVNLTSLDWNYYMLKKGAGRPRTKKSLSLTVTNDPVVASMKWTQNGPLVYCMNCIANLSRMDAHRNELWALNLNTLTFTKVNNGLCGARIKPELPDEDQWSENDICEKRAMFEYTIVCSESELWAINTESLSHYQRHTPSNRPPPWISLYRVPLVMESLCSLSLETLLHGRRPPAGLMEKSSMSGNLIVATGSKRPYETCQSSKRPDEMYCQEVRTLEHIRDFFEKNKPSLVKLCPIPQIRVNFTGSEDED